MQCSCCCIMQHDACCISLRNCIYLNHNVVYVNAYQILMMWCEFCRPSRVGKAFFFATDLYHSLCGVQFYVTHNCFKRSVQLRIIHGTTSVVVTVAYVYTTDVTTVLSMAFLGPYLHTLRLSPQCPPTDN